MIEVVKVTTGSLRQNGYVVLDGRGGAILIDPGSEAERFCDALEAANAAPLAILATHGHFDHIGAVQDLMDMYAIPFLVHTADHVLVRRANLFSGTFGGGVRIRTPATVSPLECDRLYFGALTIVCRHTPGHTPGGVCFEIDGQLLSGDTLLPWDHSANTFPGAQPDVLKTSIALISTWDQDLIVHPGHGRSNRLGDLLSRIGGSSVDGRD